MLKRTAQKAVVALLLVMLTGLAFGAGQGETTGEAEEYTIRYFGIRYIPEQKTELIEMLEEKLGVTLEIMGAYDTDYITKISPMLAANDMPDMFSQWWNEDLFSQGSAAFTEEEMKTYMPDAWAGYEEVAAGLGLEWEEVLKRFYRNGNLVAYPAVWYAGQFPHGVLWRKDVLDDLGVEVPTTLEEWGDVFAAYKDRWPNKYPYAGCGKLLWQSFSPVFDSVGIQVNHWNYIESAGRIEEGRVQPEFREILALLADWQEKGYIHPEWVTWDQPTKYNHYYNGDAIVTEWVGLYPAEPPYWPNSQQDLTSKIVSDAEFAYGPYPIWKEGVKPSRYVWNPFHGGSYGFGIHLENDKPKMYKCMEVANRLAYDEDVHMLAVYGIEGTHWEWNENGQPTRLPGASTQEEQTALGIGYYWQTLYGYSALAERLQTAPALLEARQKYALDSNGIYSQNNLQWHPNQTTGLPNSEELNELNKQYSADLQAKWEAMVTSVISGQQPISAFDEWLDYYWKNGGEAITKITNELWNQM